MYLPTYVNELNMEKFACTLNDTTECYKFYWFDAIIRILAEQDKQEISYDEIINEMIVNAWYSVSECYLNLGLKDATGESMNSLERAIKKLMKNTEISSDADREIILEEIRRNSNLLKDDKYQISKMVPYRFLSPFLEEITGNDNLWNQNARLIEYIKLVDDKSYLPYTIHDGVALQKKVVINDKWAQLFRDNYLPIIGWIRDKKVKYLQDRNPGVPSIIYKIEPSRDHVRKLKMVRKLWNTIITYTPIQDIYSEEYLQYNEYDIDHFIPCSYIANDELWNLLPMDSSLNSSKSNKLPDWNEYFESFARTQYIMYGCTHSNAEVKKAFQQCGRDNLFSNWANDELYIEGHSRHEFIGILEHYMKPIYESAQIQGYGVWEVINAK